MPHHHVVIDPNADPSLTRMIVPLLVTFCAIYFLVIRPRSKKAKIRLEENGFRNGPVVITKEAAVAIFRIRLVFSAVVLAGAIASFAYWIPNLGLLITGLAGYLTYRWFLSTKARTATPRIGWKDAFRIERKRKLKCCRCGSVQSAGAWEAAMDATAKTQGMAGFHSVGARPECLKCGSLRLVDPSDFGALERAKEKQDSLKKIPEREELRKLCRRYVAAVRGYRSDTPSRVVDREMNAIREQIADVGNRIDDEGGLDLMREIGNSLDDAEYRSVVNSSWDGIGDWRS